MYKALRREKVSIGKETMIKIMKNENLVSKYMKRRKPRNNNVNNEKTENKLDRKFNNKKPLEVLISDLTYVDINGKWHYICLLIDLYNREIVGYSAGKEKDGELVRAAWLTIKEDIRNVSFFHTDRGGEFKNEEIDKILKLAKIERSLSRPGKPIDNAVCESMYDIVKTEFIFEEIFANLEDLKHKLSAWVWWYNNERIHSSLNYKTPVECRLQALEGVTDESVKNKQSQIWKRNISLHGQKVLVNN